MNNCICSEHGFSGEMVTKIMERSAAAVGRFGTHARRIVYCSGEGLRFGGCCGQGSTA